LYPSSQFYDVRCSNKNLPAKTSDINSFTDYWSITDYCSNITDYCSYIPVILLLTAVMLLEYNCSIIAVCDCTKLNYLEITARILITATVAVILLSQSSSRSHSNVTSPRLYLDKEFL
jgi:hypothetical protein